MPRLVEGQFQSTRLLSRDTQPSLGLEGLKSQVAQFIQIAEGKQAPVHLLADIGMAAVAHLQPAKVRMPDR